MLGDKLLRRGYRLLYGEAVQVKPAYGLAARHRRIADDALFGVEALLGDVSPLDDSTYLKAESLGESVVARIVRRDCHDGACAIACQDVVRDPDGYLLESEWVNSVRAREDARNLAVGNAFTLGALARLVDISLDGVALPWRGELGGELALGGENHKSDTEDGVGAGGEDGERFVGSLDLELHLGTLRTTYPVALRLLDRV